MRMDGCIVQGVESISSVYHLLIMLYTGLITEGGREGPDYTSNMRRLLRKKNSDMRGGRSLPF